MHNDQQLSNSNLAFYWYLQSSSADLPSRSEETMPLRQTELSTADAHTVHALEVDLPPGPGQGAFRCACVFAGPHT